MPSYNPRSRSARSGANPEDKKSCIRPEASRSAITP